MLDYSDTFGTVVITNTDTNTPTQFNYVVRRLAHLTELAHSSTLPVLTPWGEGVEGAAVRGMTCVFESIPLKFPVVAVLDWLHQRVAPELPRTVVESALIELARIYA